MPHNNNMKERLLSLVPVSFFLSAVILSLYDLGCATFGLSGDVSGIAAMFSMVPVLAVAIPSACAIAAYFLTWIYIRLSERGKAFRLLADVIIAALPLSLVPGLFSGAMISVSPWRWPLTIITMLAVFAAVRTLRVITLRMFVFLEEKTSWRVPAGAASLMAVAVILPFFHKATHGILPGLYRNFHQALSIAALGLCAACIFTAVSGMEIRHRHSRLAAAWAVLLIVFWFTGMFVSREAPIARQIMSEESPFSEPFMGPLFSIEHRILRIFTGTESSRMKRRSDVGLSFSDTGFNDDAVKRSVLLVTVDCMRGDVLDSDGPFARQAVKFRKLAQSSLWFEQAYSPGNSTVYAIPSLLTGRIQTRDMERIPPDDFLPSALRLAGYESLAFFAAHDMPSIEREIPVLSRHGFYFDRYENRLPGVEDILPAAIARVSRSEGPVFVWAHPADIHEPMLMAKAGKGRRGDFPANYFGQLAFMDSYLPQFLEKVSAEYPDLVWALTADHGQGLEMNRSSGHGFSLYNEEIRVPLLIRGPGVGKGRLRHPVSTVDLGATLLHLAGADVKGRLSILPLNQAEDTGDKSVTVFSKVGCALIKGPWKLIADISRGTVGLYNLKTDPGESRNMVEENYALAASMLDEMTLTGCDHDLSMLRTGRLAKD